MSKLQSPAQRAGNIPPANVCGLKGREPSGDSLRRNGVTNYETDEIRNRGRSSLAERHPRMQWIGHFVSIVKAYGEGETEEKAIADLKEGLRAYIDVFGMDDAMARVNSPSALRQLPVTLREFSLA
jgi:hypothetical protein